MALIECPDCGREISDQAKVCPNCGRPAGARAAKAGEADILRVALWAAAALLVAIGLPVAVFAKTKNGGDVQPAQEAQPADIKSQALPDDPEKILELTALVSRLEAKVAELEAEPQAVPEPMAEEATLEALVAANDAIMETLLGEASEADSEALAPAVPEAAENGKGKERINKRRAPKDKAAKPAGAAFEATVLRVVEDDTLVVRTADHAEVKIRLYGLGAPERRPPGGASATAALKPLQGRTVTVRKMGADHYNRIVALVEHDGRVLNADLAAQGRAWYSGQYCQAQPICGRIKAAEAEARAGKKGIWAADEPVPSWTWRR